MLLNLPLIGSSIFVYLLWSVFVAGGLVNVAYKYPEECGIVDFWSGGAYYFWRFIRLTAYVILAITLFASAAFIWPNLSSLNVLEMDNESFVLVKFYTSFAIFLLFIFLVTIYRDVSKVNIVNSDNTYINEDTTAAFRNSLDLSNLSLGLLNVFVAVVIGAMYYLMKSLLNDSWFALLIVSQVYLVIRFVYKLARIGSFVQLRKTRNNS